jgi:hypothetical protein
MDESIDVNPSTMALADAGDSNRLKPRAPSIFLEHGGSRTLEQDSHSKAAHVYRYQRCLTRLREKRTSAEIRVLSVQAVIVIVGGI